MKVKVIILVALSVLVLTCKSPEALDQKDIGDFLNEPNNGLRKDVDDNGFKLIMKYKPSDFIALQQNRNGTKRQYDSLLRYYSRYLYFNLSITYEGKDLETAFTQRPETFSERITYLNNDFSRDIRVFSTKDTIELMGCAYSRSFGIGPSNFLLVFNKPKEDEIKMEVNGYRLGFGRASFTFDLADIKRTPTLRL